MDGDVRPFASLLLQNGEAIVYVKEHLGHASIQITVDIYGHLIPGANRGAVDRLDDAPTQPHATQAHPFDDDVAVAELANVFEKSGEPHFRELELLGSLDTSRRLLPAVSLSKGAAAASHSRSATSVTYSGIKDVPTRYSPRQPAGARRVTASVLTGLTMFLLARRLGLSPAAAWMAGALFIASPPLVSRDTVHFSLTMTAALPLFLWSLLRTLDNHRAADAVVTGAAVALASYSDAYFGIFATLMGAFVVAWRFTTVRWNCGVRGRHAGRGIDVAIAIVCAVIVWRLVHGPSRLVAGPLVVQLNTLYTPMLALLVCALARAWLKWRPLPTVPTPPEGWWTWIRLGLTAVASCLLLLLPSLIGMAQRVATGMMPAEKMFWRSSPRGVDLLAYGVPNPNHPWFGDRTRFWLMPPGLDAYPEYVASFSLVALILIVAALRRRLLPRMWIGFTLFFVLLSLGPFVHVAGVHRFLIGPWALLRKVPVLGMIRSPGRFAIAAILGMSLLFAFALDALLRRGREGRTPGPRALVVAVGLLLAAELAPFPRQLYSAAIPPVYRLLAESTDEPGRLLELPGGVRDGTSSLGNFSAATQFYQTAHRRPLIGGYLSRVSESRRLRYDRVPMLRALFALSEGKVIADEWREQAVRSRDDFLRESCVMFVLVHRTDAPAGLEAFAVEALRLRPTHIDDDYSLYTPADRPPCERPPPPLR